MKQVDKYQKLLNELSRDPRMKRVIVKARRSQKNGTRNVETATRMFVLLSSIAARFSKKKRARAIEELTDIVQLLVRVSLLVKENIFDRPEVKKFFRRRSKQIYLFAQEWLPLILGSTRASPRHRRL